MSEVNAADLTLISTEDDVLPLYQGAGNDARAGIEVELPFFDATTLAPMNPVQNRAVRDQGNSMCGENCIRNEPSSDMLEVSSFARGPDALRSVMKNINGKIKLLTDIAASQGLKRSWFQDLPGVTAQALLANVMDVDRYQAFFAPPRDDMYDIAVYFFICKSTQVSVSYRDPDHMLENIRRLYFLAPFLFLFTDNSSGFNGAEIFTGNHAMLHRASLKDRGLFPPYIFSAKTGEEYLREHVNHVMNNPLFVYYDDKGKMVRLPSGTWTSFNELKLRGLNTGTNYYFSQSVLWPDVKIAALRDAAGNINNHRYEARMLGVGLHQHQTALLITAGLAFNENFAQKTDALLKEFGFCVSDPALSRKNLEAAYNDARLHEGRFFDIPYGQGLMADFARRFADLLEEAYNGQGFEEELKPALTIARSGMTDGKANRLLFPTLQEAREWQKSFDPGLLERHNEATATLLDAHLKKLSAA
jgi:hypothetical protein